ncbi:hypothetical protein ACG2F4_09410 [Halalkalibaculum sp. DA3122]|uniref:hypothetical protein n=1 Tax=Halalkalibaculum sp. DA3122 TaxID=3373607 RepID=UPI003754801E
MNEELGIRNFEGRINGLKHHVRPEEFLSDEELGQKIDRLFLALNGAWRPCRYYLV